MTITSPNHPEILPFFKKETRFWFKDQIEPILLLDFLKCLNYDQLANSCSKTPATNCPPLPPFKHDGSTKKLQQTETETTEQVNSNRK